MFEKELNYIKHPVVREIAEEGISFIPDYFYHVPASSSGKYHPSYALGEGGLYRHVKSVVGIANMLFRIYKFTELDQDIIITSLILHDGWKQGFDGSDGKTWHTHPLVASDTLKEKLSVKSDLHSYCIENICSNVASHMGQWTTSENDPTILPEPETPMEKFVHLCDYIASRKPLEYNFESE